MPRRDDLIRARMASMGIDPHAMIQQRLQMARGGMTGGATRSSSGKPVPGLPGLHFAPDLATGMQKAAKSSAQFHSGNLDAMNAHPAVGWSKSMAGIGGSAADDAKGAIWDQVMGRLGEKGIYRDDSGTWRIKGVQETGANATGLSTTSTIPGRTVTPSISAPSTVSNAGLGRPVPQPGLGGVPSPPGPPGKTMTSVGGVEPPSSGLGTVQTDSAQAPQLRPGGLLGQAANQVAAPPVRPTTPGGLGAVQTTPPLTGGGLGQQAAPNYPARVPAPQGGLGAVQTSQPIPPAMYPTPPTGGGLMGSAARNAPPPPTMQTGGLPPSGLMQTASGVAPGTVAPDGTMITPTPNNVSRNAAMQPQPMQGGLGVAPPSPMPFQPQYPGGPKSLPPSLYPPEQAPTDAMRAAALPTNRSSGIWPTAPPGAPSGDYFFPNAEETAKLGVVNDPTFQYFQTPEAPTPGASGQPVGGLMGSAGAAAPSAAPSQAALAPAPTQGGGGLLGQAGATQQAAPAPAPSIGQPTGTVDVPLNLGNATGVSWDNVNQWDAAVVESGEKWGVDPALIKAAIAMESQGYATQDQSGAPASSGVLQIEDRYHRQTMIDLGYDPDNPADDIDYWARLMSGNVNGGADMVGSTPEERYMNNYFANNPGYQEAYLGDIHTLMGIINGAPGGTPQPLPPTSTASSTSTVNGQTTNTPGTVTNTVNGIPQPSSPGRPGIPQQPSMTNSGIDTTIRDMMLGAGQQQSALSGLGDQIRGQVQQNLQRAGIGASHQGSQLGGQADLGNQIRQQVAAQLGAMGMGQGRDLGADIRQRVAMQLDKAGVGRGQMGQVGGSGRTPVTGTGGGYPPQAPPAPSQSGGGQAPAPQAPGQAPPQQVQPAPQQPAPAPTLATTPVSGQPVQPGGLLGEAGAAAPPAGPPNIDEQQAAALTNAGGTGGTYYPPPTDEQLAELTTGAGGGNVAGETPPNYDEQMAAEAAPPPAQAAPPQGGLGAVETTIAGEAPPPNTVTPSETGEGQTTPGGGAAPGPMQQTQSIVAAPIVATPDPAGGSSEIGEGPPPTELVDAVCQGCGGQIIGDFKDPTTNPDYCSYATPETGFGDCTNHPGIDIGCAECFGQDVTTPVGGKVICGQTGDAPSVEYNSCAAFCQYADATLNPSGECGAGRIEVLRDGTDNQTIIYGHMNTSNVKAGDTIAPGTVLGAMGIARSPHTHMEARIICDGGGYQIVDPALVLSGHYDGYRC